MNQEYKYNIRMNINCDLNENVGRLTLLEHTSVSYNLLKLLNLNQVIFLFPFQYSFLPAEFTKWIEIWFSH